MGWPSTYEDIQTRRSEANSLKEWAPLAEVTDYSALRAELIVMECERNRYRQILETATDHDLDTWAEIVGLRAQLAEERRQLKLAQQQISNLKKTAATKERDVVYWRGAFYDLSRRAGSCRHRPSSRRRRPAAKEQRLC